MKMLMLTERVCGSELLTIRSPLGKTIFWNTCGPQECKRRSGKPTFGAVDRAQPLGVQRLALIGAHPRLVRTHAVPMACQVVRAVPEIGCQASQVGGAQSRGLLHRGNLDRHSENIGLKLHQEGVRGAATINL